MFPIIAKYLECYFLKIFTNFCIYFVVLLFLGEKLLIDYKFEDSNFQNKNKTKKLYTRNTRIICPFPSSQKIHSLKDRDNYSAFKKIFFDLRKMFCNKKKNDQKSFFRKFSSVFMKRWVIIRVFWVSQDFIKYISFAGHKSSNFLDTSPSRNHNLALVMLERRMWRLLLKANHMCIMSKRNNVKV